MLQTLNQSDVFEYLSHTFKSAKYKIDTYPIFIEKGIELTQVDGYLSYITPNTFLRNVHAQALRQLILHSSLIRQIRLFEYKVFSRPSVDTLVVALQKVEKNVDGHNVHIIRSKDPDDLSTIYIPQSLWQTHIYNHFGLVETETTNILVNKILNSSVRLGTFATAYFGIQTHDRKKYVCTNKVAEHWMPVIDGANINRYRLSVSTDYVHFEDFAIKSGGKKFVYEQERIGVRQIGMIPVACLLPAGLYTLNTIYNIYPTIETSYRLHYILGLICSRLFKWYWKQTSFDEKQTFPKIKKDALLSLPIRAIDFDIIVDADCHTKMVGLVEQMLSLNAKLAIADSTSRTFLQRQIETTDAQIDRLVYELYDLSAEEIAIVEANG